MPHSLKVLSSVAASTARGWRGSLAFRPQTHQPAEPLTLYEFEASPYCRLVREALSELDLDALILPCPKGGLRYRPEAAALGGKALFPFLVDPNTGRQLHESADIIDYLASTYGNGRPAARGLRRGAAVGTALAASLCRALPRVRGLKAQASRAPAQPLELFSFESSPYSRLVRERLCELELPYLLRNTAKARWEDIGPPQIRSTFFPTLPVEGRNRLVLLERAGRVQVPYLVDPNTGTEMFESAAILRYLDATYAA